MKLTCVTATFNCIKAGNRDRLIRCVESVAMLKTEHEHLIYDGASTDGTVELLRELEAKTPGLKVVSEPDTGIYNALNKGVRDAGGEWFYVLGADDYILDAKVLDGLIDKCRSDMIVSPVETDVDHWIPQIKNLFVCTPYGHQGVLIKTAFMRKCGGFDERFRIGADFDLMLKAHIDAIDIQYVNETFAHFSNDGVSSNWDECLKDNALIINKHFGLTAKEIVRLRNYGGLPLRLIVHHWDDKDPALRMAARGRVGLTVKHFFRTILWPFVVLRRKLRVKIAK